MIYFNTKRFSFLATAAGALMIATQHQVSASFPPCAHKLDYVLYNADTNKEVGLLDELLNKDGHYCIPDYKVSIEARPFANCTFKTESADMNLQGPVSNKIVENIGPYMIFSDDGKGDVIGRNLKEGAYVIDSEIYSKDNLKGDLIVSRKFHFETKFCKQEEVDPYPDCKIDYVLYNADADQAVGLIDDSIDYGHYCIPSYNISIEARPSAGCPTTESASMALAGPVSNKNVENNDPYFLFGDSNGDVFGRKLSPGSYSIRSDLYDQNDSKGKLIVFRKFYFEAKFCHVDPYPKCELDYVFINADQNKAVGLLDDLVNKDGHLCIPNYKFSIQAKPVGDCPTTESAGMALAGPVSNKLVENIDPYFIFSDNGKGNVIGRVLKAGNYVIDSDIFDKDDLKGNFVVGRKFHFQARNCQGSSLRAASNTTTTSGSSNNMRKPIVALISLIIGAVVF